MKLVDLNKSRDIGANCLHLAIGPFNLILDVGLHPKKVGKEALPDFSHLRDTCIDFIIISHCHLDHLGSLPVLARHQPQARILMTPASIQLAVPLLNNSHSVMLRQREELDIADYPLYTQREIEALEDHYLPMPLGRPFVFSKGKEKIEITFFSAGHIAGAAGIQIVYKHRVIFYTGDVLFRKQLIMDGAKFLEGPCDTLIIETTRGDTVCDNGKTAESEAQRLVDVLAETLKRGGSCLIPAFALGRMQEIFSIIHDARRRKVLPKSPVFASGLGMALVEHFDVISRKMGELRFRQKIVQELGVKMLYNKKIIPGKDPAEGSLYVLSSGMLVENTPSYTIAASLLNNPLNSICFVGYCDPDTPGGKLLKKSRGDTFLFATLDYVAPIRANIEKFDLSGHANREELLNLARGMDPRAIVLTHGDPPAREWFFQQISEQSPSCNLLNPMPGVAYQV